MYKDVLIYALDNQGRGIGKVNGETVFIENAMVDEVVDIEILKEKSKYMEARVISYSKKSDLRINPECKFYSDCGGCNIMHMNYDEQLKFKYLKVKNIFNKNFGDITFNDILFDSQFNYRNKVTFQVNSKIGFYKKNSYEIIPIDTCIISNSKINDLLDLIKKNINLVNINQIVIKTSINTDDSMVIFKVNNSIDEFKIINSLKDNVTSIVVFDNGYKTIYGENYIKEKIGDYEFLISPDSFFQVNTKCVSKLYDKILENSVGYKNVLDLYCGTGSIGIYISKNVESVYGVEINKYAINDAFLNLKLNGITNVDFKCLDTSLFNDVRKDIDLIIVDPPRSGLDKHTVNYLKKMKPKRLIYVSCDLMTLVRDINLLNSDYAIDNVTPVDMFPNTYHVECVCVLNRI